MKQFQLNIEYLAYSITKTGSKLEIYSNGLKKYFIKKKVLFGQSASYRSNNTLKRIFGLKIMHFTPIAKSGFKL